MNVFCIGGSGVTRTVSVMAIILGTLLAPGVSAIPAEAETLLLRRGVAAGETGAVGRTRGFVSNGEGEGAFRRGGFVGDGEGNGFAGRGGCVDGQIAGGCRGRSANWSSDGSFSGQSGAEFSGENGFFNSQRSLERDTDGNVTASRSTDASGESGAYNGASSFEDGTYNRDGTYSGTEGQSATVEIYGELGAGGARAVTCVDATGAIVDCR